MKNPLAKFLKIHGKKSKKIRQSQKVILQAREDLLKESEK